MKLHLPKSLRHAVLSCFAVVAGIASTLGTATFSAGVLAVHLAGQQAQADWSIYEPNKNRIFQLAPNTRSEYINAADKEDRIEISCFINNGASYTTNSLTLKDNQEVVFIPYYSEGEDMFGHFVETYPGPGKTANFNDLTIAKVQGRDGARVENVRVTNEANQVVSIQTVVGSLASVRNDGSFTLGTAGSTITLTGTVENNHSLTLNGIFEVDSSGSFMESEGTSAGYTDGANGFQTGGSVKLVVVYSTTADVTLGDSFRLKVGDTEYTSGQVQRDGNNIYVEQELAGTGTTYFVNTELTYNASGGMGTAERITVNESGVLHIGDTSVFSKLNVEGGTVVLTNASNVDLLKCTGTFSMDGMASDMTIDGTTVTYDLMQGAYRGNLTVCSGATLKPKSEYGVIADRGRVVTLEGTAVFDMAGISTYHKLVMGEGSTLRNSGSGVGDGKMQNPDIVLQGNATVDAQNLLCLRYGSSDSNKYETLSLNGYTLTKTGGAEFLMYQTHFLSSGTIDVKEGKLSITRWADFTGAEVNLKLQAGANLSTWNGDANHYKIFKNLTTYQGTGTGAVTLNVQNSDGVRVMGLATIDVAVNKESSGVLTFAGTTNLNAGLTITGGTLTLGGTVNVGAAITNNGGALTFAEGVVLDLIELAELQGADGMITLVTGSGSKDLSTLGLTEDNLSADTQELGSDWEFNTDGTITYSPAATTDWVWTGEGDANGGGVWGTNADNWQASSGQTTENDDVVFDTAGAGQVQVQGAVKARDITIKGGEYTFTGDGITANSMTIRGDNTSVTIKNANTIGTTTLKDGVLVFSGADAATGGNIVLEGGRLKYEGSALDISSVLSLGDRYTGPLQIEVVDDTTTTGVESVTWGTQTAAVTSGITAALTKGITKTGAGNLTLTWAQGTESGNFAGNITVSAGKLYLLTDYLEPPGSSKALNYQGAIDVAEGATVAFGTTFDASSSARLTLSGKLTGEGTVRIGGDVVHAGGNKTGGGRYKLTGDNSAFAGTLELIGNGVNHAGSAFNRVIFKDSAAFGGEDTTIVQNGRGIALEAASAVIAPTIQIEGANGNTIGDAAGKTYTFTGKLLGDSDAVWTGLNMAMNIALQGNITEYAGTLKTGNSNTWVLGGEGIASAGAVQATLAGTGTVKTQYNNATTISGAVGKVAADTLTLEQAGTGALTVSGVIGGAANVKQSGTGALVLTAANTSTGTMTIESGKKVQLGTADTAAAWAGTTLAGAGTLEIVNGSLSTTTAMSRATGATASIVVNAAAGKTVALGKTGTDLLSSVTLAAGSTLSTTAAGAVLTVGSTTTTGGLESLNLTLTTDNIGAGTAGTKAKISGAGIIINDASKVTIDLTTDGVIDLLTDHRGDQSIEDRTVVESYLTLTTGTLTCSNEQLQKLGIAGTLMSYGIRLDGVSGGSIVASGEVDGIYFVTGDNTTFPHTVSDYNTLGMYKGTVIKENQSLDIELAGDTAATTKVTLNNLLGGTGSSLEVTNTSNTGVVTVELSNKAVDDTGVNDPATIGTTTTMEGSITGNKGTELVKTGTGTLVVNGQVVADELEIAAGKLQLDGSSNNATTLNVAVNSTLQLGADSTNTITTLNNTGGTVQLGSDCISTITTLESTGGAIQLGSGSKLTVGGGELENVALTVESNATSAPELKVNGDLSLTGTTALNGVALEVVSGKTLSLAGNTNDVVALTGSGTVAGVTGTVLSLDNATDTTYGGALTGAGTLKVENGGKTFTLKNADTSAWNITNAGKMVVDMTGSDKKAGSFGAQALTLAGGSSTEFLVNTDDSDGLSLKSLIVEQGAALTLTSTGEKTIAVDSEGMCVLGTVDSLDIEDANQVVTLQGMAFGRVEKTATLIKDGNTLKLQLDVSNGNKFMRLAETTNGKAGAELMWKADTADIAASPELSGLDALLMEAAGHGESQDELLASVAGASTAVLGMAVSGDVERQLKAIRNRTTTMGVDQSVVNHSMPYLNAWINAEGDYAEMANNGTEGGYRLNNWGGTVGFDVDFTPTLTAGLALTAMYGDLTVTGADEAKGDLDTTYVSAFVRYCASAWTHTFVATAGKADLSLSRTVAGSELEGNTEGTSFGVMYEAGHVFVLNEDGTSCLQPIFNVTWRHTAIDGYEEDGSGLALEVGEQSFDVVTVGVGARYQSVVGEDMYNRTSILEARVLAKFDAGDRKGTSEVSLAGATAEVESTEVGAFGMEAGAGITIPLGDAGSSIFADASVELRADYVNVNGTVGYRINF